MQKFSPPPRGRRRQGNDNPNSPSNPLQIQTVLWYKERGPPHIDNLTISPTHQDLHRIADAASAVLSDAFVEVPEDSGVKAFLQSPNTHGWDVKRKLVWLGTHSFMFRTMFARYMEEQPPGGSDIAHIDDFVCQECTRWSGLGAIDILAGALDISDDDRKDLRSWYERHAAFYKIESVEKQRLEALNLINDQPYQIRIDMTRNPFKRGQVVFGSLVPWRGEWYWSGEQRLVGDASKVDADDLKKKMKRQSSAIVCRYSKDYEALVRERMSDLHEQMLAFHGGKDLVVYPDGLSMAADWQKELRWQWEQRPQQEVDEVVRKHGLKEGRPDIKIPQDLLEEKDGLGVFLNPDEGKEIMSHFTTLLAGLRKKGEGLTGDEADSIRGFFESPCHQPEVRQAGAGGTRRRVGEDGVRAEGRPAGLLAGLPAAEPQGTLLPEMLSVAVGGVRDKLTGKQFAFKSRPLSCVGSAASSRSV